MILYFDYSNPALRLFHSNSAFNDAFKSGRLPLPKKTSYKQGYPLFSGGPLLSEFYGKNIERQHEHQLGNCHQAKKGVREIISSSVTTRLLYWVEENKMTLREPPGFLRLISPL